MIFDPIKIELYENPANDWRVIYDVIKIGPGSRIIKSVLEGPFYMNRNTQLGPDVRAGKYSGLNESCFIARAELGAYCAIGARTSINPFNHPIDWLSIHEFQYHAKAYDWVPEWNDFQRIEDADELVERVSVGNDVWMGHNVNVMAGVTVGDGAVIAAGSVVTRAVPPYAIIAGVPATVRKLRFDERTIERLLKVKWWEFELSQLSGLNFRNVNDCLPRLEEMRAELEARAAAR